MTANELNNLDDILKGVEEIRSRVLEFIANFEYPEEETVLQPRSKVADSETDGSPVLEVTE